MLIRNLHYRIMPRLSLSIHIHIKYHRRARRRLLCRNIKHDRHVH
jgi:hypothetical protein